MTELRVVGVYAGGPREVATPAGGPVYTALLKEPREGTVRVTAAGIEGDGWGSPEVHGLPDQALCLYPAEHWPALRAALAGERGPGTPESLVQGAFGENLAVEGGDEDAVRIASRWRWGGVLLEVTKPRAPCATLTRVHGLPTLAKVVARTARTGWYCRVLEGGEASASDPLVLVDSDPGQATVSGAWRAHGGG